MEKGILFVTGNELKFAVAQRSFAGSGFSLLREKHDCPEIQDMDVSAVVSYSVKHLAATLKKPVVKSDQGFYLEAFGGFPGAYMHDVERTIGERGFLNLMRGEKNRAVKFVEALAYCEPGKEPVIFVGEIRGTLAEELCGEHGSGIDFLFIPEGETRTVACRPESHQKEIYDFKLWQKLLEHLTRTK